MFTGQGVRRVSLRRCARALLTKAPCRIHLAPHTPWLADLIEGVASVCYSLYSIPWYRCSAQHRRLVCALDMRIIRLWPFRRSQILFGLAGFIRR